MSSVVEKDMQLLQRVCQTIFDKSGFNILALDVRAFSAMTDYYIIAEGNVEKHVQAIAKAIIQECKGQECLTEGLREGDWVVSDFGNVVIHLFIPEMREKYALEELWRQATIIDVPIITKIAK